MDARDWAAQLSESIGRVALKTLEFLPNILGALVLLLIGWLAARLLRAAVSGDAVELRALEEVFGGRDQPLPLGSLKSNLGHLITAAGVAAAIKVLEAMKAGVRPQTLHADRASEQVAAGPFRLLHEAEPWTDPVRRAGISAFGFGGNNGHMILEEYRGPLAAESVRPPVE